MREWWRDAVIYQIYPRSFQDDNNDGIGDLAGITRRLDHVADLGVDAIWLSPFFTSPMKDMGYDVADYRGIDPLFGTMEDFDALLSKACDLGLKVIIDQVLSHTSDQHEWFKQSRTSREDPKSDWYVWADPSSDGTPPNNWPSVFGGPAWEWEPRRGQYYLHNFLIEQPDLNLRNTEVQEALLDVLRFWLDRGVDGFRLDVANYFFHDDQLRSNPPAKNANDPGGGPYAMQDHIYTKNRPETLGFLERLRDVCDGYPDRMIVGEIAEGGDRAINLMADYTRGAKRLHMCYSFEMLGPHYSAGHFRSRIEVFQKGAPDGHACWSFSNHDVARHVTRWADHAKDPVDLAKQAVALLMSFPGTIGIYQGEELGQTETVLQFEELTDPPGIRFWPDGKGRDGCRTPMVWDKAALHGGFSTVDPWLPVKSPQLENAVSGQITSNDSVMNSYKAMMAYRKSSAALRDGDTHFLDLPEPLFGIVRRADDASVTCLFNLSKDAAVVSINGEARLEGPCHGTVEDGVLHLPANGYAFLAHHQSTKISADNP